MPAILIDLRDKDIGLESLVLPVELLKKGHFHLYRMVLGGYWLLYSVSKKYAAAEATYFCLQDNGDLRIVVAEGRPVIENLAKLFQTLG
jgi:hypothetical protein